MKSTSGLLALRCPRPQAPSGTERPSDTPTDAQKYMQTQHVAAYIFTGTNAPMQAVRGNVFTLSVETV